jgi:hypothetical protein
VELFAELFSGGALRESGRTMVDWREVERLRSKGWDWASIAVNPKVSFAPPEGAGEPGRALKALYLNRKSRRSRSSRGQSVDEEEGQERQGRGVLGNRFFIGGVFLALTTAVWSGVVLYRPAPFGVLLPFFPDLLVGLLLGVALIGLAFAFGTNGIRGMWVKPLVIGVVIGLVGVGLSGYVAYSQGYLSLGSAYQYSGGWQKASNPLWLDGGRPVVFFMGSAACPFCSASSWSIRDALQAFGGLTGWTYATSSSTDSAGPNTAEVTLYGTTLGGSYLAWDPQEDSNTQTIQQPALSPTEKSYLLAYNPSGSIPFIVFGGIYIHTGTYVSPAALCVNQQIGNPYTPQQIDQQIQSQSGPAYQSILAQTYLLEAYFLKLDQLANITPPSTVASDPNVQADLRTIP